MATIYCMRCGTALDGGVRYCPACGATTRLGMEAAEREGLLVCPACGTPNEAGAVRCASCGVGLPVPADAAAHETPAGGYVPDEGAYADARSAMRPRTLLYGVIAALLLLAVVAGGLSVSGAFGRRGAQGSSGEPAEAAPESTAVADENVGSAGVPVRAGLADYSWKELSVIGRRITALGSMNEALTITHEYHLTDDAGHLVPATKDVVITGVGTVPMRLAGVLHDDLADGEGKAGLTFLSADATLTHEMKANDDNIGGWEASQLRSWLDSEIYPSLDEELAPMIVAVDKHTNNVGRTVTTDAVTSTLDRLWVPSLVEVCGPISWLWESDPSNSGAYNDVLNAEGTQYALFEELGVQNAADNPSLVLAGAEGAPMSWWLRSCSASKDAHYRLVDVAGNPSRWEAATVRLGVCLGFCL